MRVAIYVRVSTEEQNPENQTNELQKYAQRMEYQVFGTYIDRCSGLKDSRPEFNRLLEDMRRMRFDAILVWKLDRIGRSLQHLLNLLQEMDSKKVDFICLTQNIDTTSASGRLLFNLLGAFAQFESSLISERTKAGMDRAKRQGKNIGRPKKDKKCIVAGCRKKVDNPDKLCDFHKQESVAKKGGYSSFIKPYIKESDAEKDSL